MSSEKPDTRTRILDSAWKLLESGTGGEVRMSDIARAAGISRQALYLHFPKRAELLVATTLHVDAVKNVDARLAASRAATGGVERLDAFIEAWGNYIPEIYGVGRALMAMQETDAEARHAWESRMQAVREGCEAAVRALERDGVLSPDHPGERATDLLWTLLSVRNWEQLVRQCGWTQKDYVEAMKRTARQTLVRQA
ncbi:TetR/AcrR family transcriptional regulator [Oricola indica]|jgi:AcrR family transcriptional regulator|uniref:TetR/AcrR family transcriptional regulator n=1 Tax=Oricola indica TaxID=2872591 RepID=UPI001CBF4C7B|nr:TetR/AcrR family transcriptional regulator [Oricola indica]